MQLKFPLNHFGFTALLFSILFCAESAKAAPLGGLAYGYVNWPAGSYSSIDQKVRIDAAPATNSLKGYFWGSRFHAGDMVANVGFQQLQNGARIAIFSMADTVSANAARGFVSEPFSGNSVGVIIKGRYPWIEGRIYRFRIWHVASDWWSAWILDTVTGDDINLGEIKNQRDPGMLLSSNVTFTEQITGEGGCLGASAVRSTWYLPTGNNATVPALSITPAVATALKCGDQIASTVNQDGQAGLHAQIVCAVGGKANLLRKGSCWRFGNQGQSCDQVCGTHGVDLTFWPNGQDLSNSQCNTLHKAFNHFQKVSDGTWPDTAAGCISYYRSDLSQLWNIITPAWSSSASSLQAARLCGCAG